MGRAFSCALPMSMPRLFLLALLRVVAGVVDVAWLCTRPRLLHWFVAAKRLPTYDDAADDDDDSVYGDVFVAPTAALLRACGARAGVVVVDVGCGVGHVLIAARAVGAAARGLEVDPARALPAHARNNDVEVVIADAVAGDYGDADIVWCSWLTWSATTRAALTTRLAQTLKPEALVITLGHAVDDGSAFVVVARSTMWCSWGRADVVVSRKR